MSQGYAEEYILDGYLGIGCRMQVTGGGGGGAGG